MHDEEDFASLKHIRRLFPEYFRTTVTLGEGKTYSNVHPAAACEGRGCVIHHPSDHRMKNWPQDLRRLANGAAVTDRFCAHRVPHADPDDVEYYKSIGQDVSCAVNPACDNCCSGNEELRGSPGRRRRR